MIRHLCVVCTIFLVLVVVGCGSVTRSIIGRQEWSENYAAAEGVEATSPNMIDGDLSTIGETRMPTSGGAGTTSFSEAIVKLPEKKSIRRVVLYTPNIRSLSMYAAGDSEDEWKLLDETKNSEEKKLVLNVSTVTDAIKIRVRRTSDDTVVPVARGRRKRMRYAKGKIQEIEIYGMVEEGTAQVARQAEGSGVPGAPQKAEKPKAPPAVLSLESPQSNYTLSVPIPVRIDLKIGHDDLAVLEDYVTDEMLSTKLLVKTASGEKISCSKSTPPLSSPRPYRGSGRPVNVRNAKTLDADSVLTVNIANLLEYYPIEESGNYTVQLDMELEVHSRFVGRDQTQIEDLERTIRDIGTKENYSQTERAGITSGLKEEIEQLKKKKGKKYIVVGTRGKSLDLKSNVLELVIQ